MWMLGRAGAEADSDVDVENDGRERKSCVVVFEYS